MARKRVINLTANRTLSKNESGALVVLDKSDGITVTLPSAGRGLVYEFVLKSDIKSGNATITAVGDDKIRGYLQNVYFDEDTEGKTWVSDGTTFKKYEANGVSEGTSGPTTGGLRGTYVKLVCDNDGKWNASGINVSGTTGAATPFKS